MSERERAQAGGVAEAEAEREAGSPLSKEPDAELDPKTLGSRPGPRQQLNRLSHPGVPLLYI